MEVAGLSAVMPLTPVATSVIRASAPLATSRRYRLLVPLRSETKYTREPSADQCGSMFLASGDDEAPASGRIGPVASPSVASWWRPNSRADRDEENRSVAKTSRDPSGDHAGCRSEYASDVSGRT